MPTGLPGVTRANFASPITELAVFRVVVGVDPGWTDVTAVEDTQEAVDQAEFVRYRGRLWGWIKSGGPRYDTISGTLTIPGASGVGRRLSGTAKLRAVAIEHAYGGRGGDKVPCVYDWIMIGAVVSVEP